MDRSTLASRIAEILGTGPRRPAVPPVVRPALDEEQEFAIRCAESEARADLLDVLQGRLLEGARGPSVVIEREFPPDHRHGRARIGEIGASAGRASALDLLDRGGRTRPPLPVGDPAGGVSPDLLFFDLETTGLSGGAGTYAFLVGFAGFDPDGTFRTRQFFLRSYGEEAPLLDAVEAFLRVRLGAAGAAPPDEPRRAVLLVTYNGRAFDLPLIETRFLMHRLPSPFDSLPHLDLLHPARRLWRVREPATRELPGESRFDRPAGWPAAGRGRATRPLDRLASSCALGMLEQDLLAVRRDDDVPGFEIPARYFHFARTGDARGLAAVLEHNRQDLLSLAALTALAVDLVDGGAGSTRAPHECLALGRLYEGAGRFDQAAECYREVAEAARWPDAPDGRGDGGARLPVQIEGLRHLARRFSRERCHDAAAAAWQQLLALGPDPLTEREACEALAIHHEHRSRDLATARGYAVRALTGERDTRRAAELQHRLNRLNRKMSRASLGPGRG